MAIAASADQITPLAVGSMAPDGPLVAMKGQQTTLKRVLNDKASIVIFYRGDW